MKKFAFSLLGFFIALTINAQAPNSFNYQAVVRNSDGTIKQDESVSLQIEILQGTVDGSSVYLEIHNTTTNSFGLVNLEIGTGTTSDDLASIDWSSGPYYLSLTVNGANMGATQLLSVPYAIHSQSAETITGEIDYTETDPIFSAWDKSSGITLTESQISDLKTYLTEEVDPTFTAWDKSYNDLTNTPSIIDSINAIIDTTTQFVRTEVDGSVTNEIQNLADVIAVYNSANAQIKNLTDPTDDQDAVTKSYLDNLLIQIGDVPKLLNAGFTVQQLIDGGHPVADLVAAGASVADLLAVGASVADLVAAGVSVADLVAAGATNKADYIGLLYEGGMIFYVDVTDDGTGIGTGLVCTLSDQSTNAEWGCFGSSLSGASETAIGTGSQNTIDIEAGCATGGTAADICANLSLNGYTDWFLPSMDELNLMWLNLADSDGDDINTGPSDPNNLGGFTFNYYWSSSEVDSQGAWAQDFGSGNQALGSKENTIYVRAIRAF